MADRPEDIPQWAWDQALETFDDWRGPGPVKLVSAGSVARALLKAREEAFEWQPVETAPKDGSRILIFVDGRVEASRWKGERSGTHPWHDDDNSSSWRADVPTHWMPMPSPPAIRLHSQKGER